MNSFDKSITSGVEVTTGEKWSRIPGKNRSFISITDSIGVATKYASLSSDSKEFDGDSFGVIIGMDTEALEDLDAFTVESDVVEIGVMDHIPLDHIKTLTVPKEKVAFVKKLVGELSIEVVGAEINDPFYRMNRIDKIGHLMNSEKIQPSALKEYKKEDMDQVAKKGILSRIMSLFGNKDRNNSRRESMSYGNDGR